MVSKETNHLVTGQHTNSKTTDKLPGAMTVRSVLLNRDSPDIESHLKRRRNRTQQVRFKDLEDGLGSGTTGAKSYQRTAAECDSPHPFRKNSPTSPMAPQGWLTEASVVGAVRGDMADTIEVVAAFLARAPPHPLTPGPTRRCWAPPPSPPLPCSLTLPLSRRQCTSMAIQTSPRLQKPKPSVLSNVRSMGDSVGVDGDDKEDNEHDEYYTTHNYLSEPASRDGNGPGFKAKQGLVDQTQCLRTSEANASFLAVENHIDSSWHNSSCFSPPKCQGSATLSQVRRRRRINNAISDPGREVSYCTTPTQTDSPCVSPPNTPPPLTVQPCTCPPPSTVGPSTCPPPSTVGPSTSPPPSTVEPSTSPPPSTVEPSTSPPPSTVEPSTCPPPSTVRPSTCPPPSTVGPSTSPPPSTVQACTTKTQTDRPSTFSAPSTVRPSISSPPTVGPSTSQTQTVLHYASLPKTVLTSTHPRCEIPPLVVLPCVSQNESTCTSPPRKYVLPPTVLPSKAQTIPHHTTQTEPVPACTSLIQIKPTCTTTTTTKASIPNWPTQPSTPLIDPDTAPNCLNPKQTHVLAPYTAQFFPTPTPTITPYSAPTCPTTPTPTIAPYSAPTFSTTLTPTPTIAPYSAPTFSTTQTPTIAPCTILTQTAPPCSSLNKALIYCTSPPPTVTSCHPTTQTALPYISLIQTIPPGNPPCQTITPGNPPCQTIPPGNRPCQTIPPGNPLCQTIPPGNHPCQTVPPGNPPCQTIPPGNPPCQTVPPGNPPCQIVPPGNPPCQTIPPGNPPCQTIPPGNPPCQTIPPCSSQPPVVPSYSAHIQIQTIKYCSSHSPIVKSCNSPPPMVKSYHTLPTDPSCATPTKTVPLYASTFRPAPPYTPPPQAQYCITQDRRVIEWECKGERRILPPPPPPPPPYTPRKEGVSCTSGPGHRAPLLRRASEKEKSGRSGSPVHYPRAGSLKHKAQTPPEVPLKGNQGDQGSSPTKAIPRPTCLGQAQAQLGAQIGALHKMLCSGPNTPNSQHAFPPGQYPSGARGCSGSGGGSSAGPLTSIQADTLRQVQEILGGLVSGARSKLDPTWVAEKLMGPNGPLHDIRSLQTQLHSLEGVLETSQNTIKVLLDVIQDLEKKEAERDGRHSYRTGQDIENCGTCRDCACIIYSVEHDFRLQEGAVTRTWRVEDPPEGSPLPAVTPQPTTPHRQETPLPVTPARPPHSGKKSRKKCFWFL